jgi:hypothetical protein
LNSVRFIGEIHVLVSAVPFSESLSSLLIDASIATERHGYTPPKSCIEPTHVE